MPKEHPHALVVARIEAIRSRPIRSPPGKGSRQVTPIDRLPVSTKIFLAEHSKIVDVDITISVDIA